MINMIVPCGVTFKFTVQPSMSKYHQEGVRHYIIKESGLSNYFRHLDVEFFDCCYVDKDGLSKIDDKLNGKQMQVKIFCPEAIIAIDKNKEEDFYQQINKKFSEWLIDLIQSNEQTKYTAKLEAFSRNKPLL